MGQISKKVTATILSMSLLTVMAGAAIAPALGIIRRHFADEPKLLIQLIVALPSLFTILTSLFFLPISRVLHTRAIALLGLALYVAAGAGCYLAADIHTLLVLRALLGVSVGLIMPLSTGLLAYYFPPEAQARVMGLSASMNQLGGVVATLLAGLLATLRWNCAFLVYLLGLLAIVLVLRYLPAEKLGSANKRGRPFEPRQLLKFHPSVVGMLLLMIIFFIFPTNFALLAERQAGLSAATVTAIMVGLDLIACITGLYFHKLMHAHRRSMKYFAPVLFFLGYLALGGAGRPSPGGAGWMAPVLLVVGAALVGVATGLGVPYLNTIASIKGGRNSATTVMPLLSAALYLGQFASPLIVTPLAHVLFGPELVGTYKVGLLLCLLFLWQVWATRHFQSLPPEEK